MRVYKRMWTLKGCVGLIKQYENGILDIGRAYWMLLYFRKDRHLLATQVELNGKSYWKFQALEFKVCFSFKINTFGTNWRKHKWQMENLHTVDAELKTQAARIESFGVTNCIEVKAPSFNFCHRVKGLKWISLQRHFRPASWNPHVEDGLRTPRFLLNTAGHKVYKCWVQNEDIWTEWSCICIEITFRKLKWSFEDTWNSSLPKCHPFMGI